jgi:hypothetical protein
MAATTVLSAELLAAAGVPTAGTLYPLIVGRTAGDARETLETILQVAGINRAIGTAGIVRYSVDGQSADYSLSEIDAALRLCRRLASTGGGPVSIRVRFA